MGVAFEGGKALRTPELVPFRLTRDIVDGLGVEGVDGALRVCAEATLSVLRAAQQAVVTIVEVRGSNRMLQGTTKSQLRKSFMLTLSGFR